MIPEGSVSTGSLAAPPLEYALQAVALARLAGSLAHEVKNPLNAMALQLALLGDKIATASESLASGCAGNLASLKNQIGRVNEVVRRYLEVADPTPSAGFDAGALLSDVVILFGHEARRRRVALSYEGGSPTARAAGDPVRVARLVLGLLWSTLSATSDGGRVTARTSLAEADVVLSLDYTRGKPDPALGWVNPVLAGAAAELGGRFEESSRDDTTRAALALPKERAP